MFAQATQKTDARRARRSPATWTFTSTSLSSTTRNWTSIDSSCSSRTASPRRIRFVGELELEHAVVEGLEEKGELELEQAYVDFLLSRSFNVRAGMMLMPIGIINERHEPPVYLRRRAPLQRHRHHPDDLVRNVGAGVHGEVGRGWRYRAFVVAPLDAAEFSAEEGIREGRQKGSEANVGRPAVTGRLEYVAIRGLTLGASGWSGRSGFSVPSALRRAGVTGGIRRAVFASSSRAPWTVLAGLDRQRRATERRARHSCWRQSRTSRESCVASTARLDTGRSRIASFGEVGAFVRYENFDTQFRMPAGYVGLPEFDRDAWVVGANYWPDPDVAVKFDYSIVRNRSTVIQAPNSLNIGPGMVVLMRYVFTSLALLAVATSSPAKAGHYTPLAVASGFSRTEARKRQVDRDQRRAFQLQPLGDSRQGGHQAGDSADERGHDARLSHPGHRHRSRASQTWTRCRIGHVSAHRRSIHVRVLQTLRRRAFVHARRHHRHRVARLFMSKPDGSGFRRPSRSVRHRPRRVARRANTRRRTRRSIVGRDAGGIRGVPAWSGRLPRSRDLG